MGAVTTVRTSIFPESQSNFASLLTTRSSLAICVFSSAFFRVCSVCGDFAITIGGTVRETRVLRSKRDFPLAVSQN